MTREDAIANLNMISVAFVEPVTKEQRKLIDDTFDMAIQALEQEPCSDAISRQAVETLVDELARAISDERCCVSRGRSTATIMQDILDLPPVNPQQKTGHWITRPYIYGVVFCSECGFELRIDDTKFCPNCGARMESEEV